MSTGIASKIQTLKLEKKKEGNEEFLPNTALIILPLLAIACCVLPFATYTYKGITYDFTGLQLLTGAVIGKGTVTVASSTMLILALVCCLVTSLCAAASLRFKDKDAVFWRIDMIAVLAGFIFFFVVNMQMDDALDGVRNVTITYGLYLALILLILAVVCCVRLLYLREIVTTLDFMALPGTLYLLINNYIPMFGITLAFKDIDFSKGIFNSDWVGLDNFVYLLSDLPLLLRNTILYNVAFIILGNLTGIIVGMMLSELAGSFRKKFYQTAILLPNLISWVIIGYIAYGFLATDAGWINNTILGEDNYINFYITKWVWPFILIFINTWKGLGYNAVIYLSSILGIDRSLYESAMVDGAGRWQQFTKITLPCLRPTIITLVLLSVGRIMYSDFGLFYQVPMNSGYLNSVTQTIDTYVYRALIDTGSLSRAAAAGALQSVVGFILVVSVNAIIRKADRNSALF